MIGHMATFRFRTIIEEEIRNVARVFHDDPRVAEVLLEITLSIANFQEEGQPIAPLVFIGTDLETICNAVRGASPLPIGHGPFDADTAQRALKSCVPLGKSREWAAYLLKKGDRLEYGVLCTETSTLQLTSFEALRRSSRVEGSPVLGLTRLGKSVVELRGVSGERTLFDFSGRSEDLVTFPEFREQFVAAVTRDIPADIRDLARTFFYRVAVDILLSEHGSLVAVLKDSNSRPLVLDDGIWFEQAVDIADLIRSYAEPTDKKRRSLGSHARLIRSMIEADGITIFAPDGTLRGYRAFVRRASKGESSVAGVGGARRRAFDILREEVGDSLLLAMYRSQDGARDICAAVDLASH